jgi:hypothetical protein
VHRISIAGFHPNGAIMAPEDTIFQAALVMEANNRQPLLVHRNGKPVGVLTEDDIVAKVLAAGKDPRLVKVGEIMEAAVPAAGGTELLVEDEDRNFSPLHASELLSKDDGQNAPMVRELVQRGLCEECETDQEFLFDLEGAVLCEDCYESHPDAIMAE